MPNVVQISLFVFSLCVLVDCLVKKNRETLCQILKYLLLKAKGVAVLSTEMSLVGKWQMEHLSTEIENKTGK